MADSYNLALGGLQVHCQQSVDQASARIRLEGELDNLSLPVLRQALERLYGGECYQIVVDLSGLDFIDSSGLGTLISAWRRCSEPGGSLVVANPTPPVRRLMDMTGVSKILGLAGVRQP